MEPRSRSCRSSVVGCRPGASSYRDQPGMLVRCVGRTDRHARRLRGWFVVYLSVAAFEVTAFACHFSCCFQLRGYRVVGSQCRPSRLPRRPITPAVAPNFEVAALLGALGPFFASSGGQPEVESQFTSPPTYPVPSFRTGRICFSRNRIRREVLWLRAQADFVRRSGPSACVGYPVAVRP